MNRLALLFAWIAIACMIIPVQGEENSDVLVPIQYREKGGVADDCSIPIQYQEQRQKEAEQNTEMHFVAYDTSIPASATALYVSDDTRIPAFPEEKTSSAFTARVTSPVQAPARDTYQPVTYAAPVRYVYRTASANTACSQQQVVVPAFSVGYSAGYGADCSSAGYAVVGAGRVGLFGGRREGRGLFGFRARGEARAAARASRGSGGLFGLFGAGGC